MNKQKGHEYVLVDPSKDEYECRLCWCGKVTKMEIVSGLKNVVPCSGSVKDE